MNNILTNLTMLFILGAVAFDKDIPMHMKIAQISFLTVFFLSLQG
ncbi:hypothetical protein LFU01_28150 [Lysinibacillus fusiformis]|nr:hypothetical protein LFU01_28150 [Lysinibacillus fusiformis]